MDFSTKLGFSKGTKLLMIHADDAGLANSENQATIQALENGIVNSYSIMVPCAGFEEMATYAKDNPQFDYGIHLTLTCEWETNRFGTVLPISEASSLVDENGHFFKKRHILEKNASLPEIRKELEAQIEKALDFGLQPTHFDSHMYSVGTTPEFFNIYRELGQKYKLPILINKEMLEMVTENISPYFEPNDFVIDRIHIGEFANFKDGDSIDYYDGTLTDYYYHVLDNLDSGLNILLIHTAFDDAQMQEIARNHPNYGAEWRQVDFDFCTSEKSKMKLKENNIQLINWRDIKRLWDSV